MTESGQNYIDRLRKIREKYGCMISNDRSICPARAQDTDKFQASIHDHNQTEALHGRDNNYFHLDPSFHRINRGQQLQTMRKQYTYGSLIKDINYQAEKLQRSINQNQQRLGLTQFPSYAKHHTPSFNTTPTKKNTNHFDKIASYGASLIKDQQNRLNANLKDHFSMKVPGRNNRFERSQQPQNKNPRQHSQNWACHKQNRSTSQNRFVLNVKEENNFDRTMPNGHSKPIQTSHSYNQIDFLIEKKGFNKQFYDYSFKNEAPRRKVFAGVGSHGQFANTMKQNSNDMIKTIRNSQNKNGKWSIQNFDKIQRKIQGVLNQRF